MMLDLILVMRYQCLTHTRAGLGHGVEDMARARRTRQVGGRVRMRPERVHADQLDVADIVHRTVTTAVPLSIKAIKGRVLMTHYTSINEEPSLLGGSTGPR